MKRVMVRYKVKPDMADENIALIQRVFDELAGAEPGGLRYASLVLEDGVSFVHMAEIDTPTGANPLGETAAFKAFQKEIKDRCEEPPVAVTYKAVGNYRLL